MSGRLDICSGEKMAIPVEGGAQEQMDVSIEDSASYVDIKTKGPGKPIIIRSDVLDQIASQFYKSNYTGPNGPNSQYKEYGIDGSSESFLDKKTGSAFTLDNNVAKDKDNMEDTESDEVQDQELNAKVDSTKLKSQLDISEENIPQMEARFRSQSKVVSIGPKYIFDKPEILNTPKKKYLLGQTGTKKNVGTKKNSPGKADSNLKLVKRPAPYPNWMDLPIKDIVGKPFVDKDGNMHQWELQLVPVESNVVMKKVYSMQMTNDKSSEDDIILEGSIDRPPDEAMHLEDNHNPTEAVHGVAHTQPSTTDHYNVGSDTYSHSYQDATAGAISAPYIYNYDNDQPLDLTVEKPLDLSMKNKPENKAEDFHLEQEDEEVDNVMGNAAASKTTAESDITNYRTQCSSVSSIYDKEYVQGDETYDSLTDHCPRETDQQIITDSNLPSLGKLTLESNSQAQNSTSVQDAEVRDAMVNNVQCQDNTVSGQQNILNLVNTGKVTFGQLLALYYQNQLHKSANIPTAVLSQLATKQEQDMNQVQQLQSQIAVSHVPHTEDKVDIPTPAMPNLCSLELANDEGGILVRKEEAMKNRLKEKILQKR